MVVGLGLMKRRRSLLVMGRSGGDGKDVRVMVWWFRRPEAVWGCKCEMEVSWGKFHLREAKTRKRLFCRRRRAGRRGEGCEVRR